jgi:hypothetical protein
LRALTGIAIFDLEPRATVRAAVASRRWPRLPGVELAPRSSERFTRAATY